MFLDKSAKSLNITPQRYINCYLHNAYFLCIILFNENLHAWFYENYMQLYFSADKVVRNISTPEIFLDFYGGWTEPRKLLDCYQISRDDIETVNIIHFIKENIDNEKYIYTYVDEHYTKKNVESNNSHDIFIYGYNDFTQEVMVIGFDETLTFKEYSIGYNDFVQGFNSGIEVSKEYDQLSGINYCQTITPKYNSEYKYEFNLDNYLALLYDYINSINTSEKITTQDSNYDLYKVKTNIFGIDVYDKLINEINYSITNKTALDYRPFHTIYEHKNIMLLRMKYLFKHMNLDESKYSYVFESCIKLTNTAAIARMKTLKYNKTKQMKILDTLIKDIEQIRDLERVTYPKIYTLLSNHLN